jgi:hypothetical protein
MREEGVIEIVGRLEKSLGGVSGPEFGSFSSSSAREHIGNL